LSRAIRALSISMPNARKKKAMYPPNAAGML
jgi:hypothetical protein